MPPEFRARAEPSASSLETRSAAGKAGPLPTLEALRRDAVDTLARSLRDARQVLSQRAVAVSSARADLLHCEQRLLSERAAFAAAHSVRALQAVSLGLRALEAELVGLGERVRRTARAEQEASAELERLSRALLSAERDRRAASSVLDGQRQAQLRVNARVEEEEAEEAFRARR